MHVPVQLSPHLKQAAAAAVAPPKIYPAAHFLALVSSQSNVLAAHATQAVESPFTPFPDTHAVHAFAAVQAVQSVILQAVHVVALPKYPVLHT